MRRFSTLVVLCLSILSPRFGFSQVSETIQVDDLVERDGTALNRALNGGVVSYAESLKRARPAVVSVYSRIGTKDKSQALDELLWDQLFGNPDEPFGHPRLGLGSGVIVSENGYILTNYHVVKSAETITVQGDDQKVYDATLVGTDPSTDIAVLKIEATELPTVSLANSDAIEVGDVVFAIGNPLGLGKTVTMGIVSATKRQEMGIIDGGFENFIQTDAPINTGNSGGALVDAMGRLIGINTLIQTDGASSGNIGIGFAVPANMAYSVMKDLIERGTVLRGFLGVGIEGIDEKEAAFYGLESLQGALVNQVSPGTPAEKAGLKVGDVVLSIDGAAIDSPSDLRVTIAARKPGESVVIDLIRDRKPISVTVVLADRDGSFAAQSREVVEEETKVQRTTFFDGISVTPLDEALREAHRIDASVVGLLVSEVAGDSPYAGELPEGMVILKLNGVKPKTEREAIQAMKDPGKNTLSVFYRGVYRWVTIELK